MTWPWTSSQFFKYLSHIWDDSTYGWSHPIQFLIINFHSPVPFMFWHQPHQAIFWALCRHTNPTLSRFWIVAIISCAFLGGNIVWYTPSFFSGITSPASIWLPLRASSPVDRTCLRLLQGQLPGEFQYPTCAVGLGLTRAEFQAVPKQTNESFFPHGPLISLSGLTLRRTLDCMSHLGLRCSFNSLFASTCWNPEPLLPKVSSARTGHHGLPTCLSTEPLFFHLALYMAEWPTVEEYRSLCSCNSFCNSVPCSQPPAKQAAHGTEQPIPFLPTNHWASLLLTHCKPSMRLPQSCRALQHLGPPRAAHRHQEGGWQSPT